MKRQILIAAALACFAQAGFAQQAQVGVNFLMGQPQNEFKDNIDSQGFGVGGIFTYRPGSSPLLFGAELDFAIYGQESRRVPFSLTIPDVTVEVNTSNNIVIFQPLLRLQPGRGAIRPYVDGFVGMHYLFTQTSIKDEDAVDGNTIASTDNEEDVAFSYGYGGGVMMRVHRASNNRRGKSSLKEVLIDLRVRNSLGNEATYLKKGAIRRDNGTVEIDALQSRTDLMIYQLGVVFSW